MQDLQAQMADLNEQLAGVRVILRMSHKKEAELIQQRAQVREQLRQASTPICTIRAEVAVHPEPDFNGTTEPVCHDCTAEDG